MAYLVTFCIAVLNHELAILGATIEPSKGSWFKTYGASQLLCVHSNHGHMRAHHLSWSALCLAISAASLWDLWSATGDWWCCGGRHAAHMIVYVCESKSIDDALFEVDLRLMRWDGMGVSVLLISTLGGWEPLTEGFDFWSVNVSYWKFWIWNIKANYWNCSTFAT